MMRRASCGIAVYGLALRWIIRFALSAPWLSLRSILGLALRWTIGSALISPLDLASLDLGAGATPRAL